MRVMRFPPATNVLDTARVTFQVVLEADTLWRRAMGWRQAWIIRCLTTRASMRMCALEGRWNMKFHAKRIAVLALAVVMALSLVVGVFITSRGVAYASGGGSGTGNTIAVSNIELVNRVGVNVTVTFTCTLPANAYVYPWESGFGGATVSQAVGNTINSVGGEFSFAPSQCDGHSHSLVISSTLQNGSTPLHPGPAVVSASFSLQYFDFTNFTYGSVGASMTNTPMNISA